VVFFLQREGRRVRGEGRREKGEGRREKGEGRNGGIILKKG
jgi:hypothetical protein